MLIFCITSFKTHKNVRLIFPITRDAPPCLMYFYLFRSTSKITLDKSLLKLNIVLFGLLELAVVIASRIFMSSRPFVVHWISWWLKMVRLTFVQNRRLVANSYWMRYNSWISRTDWCKKSKVCSLSGTYVNCKHMLIVNMKLIPPPIRRITKILYF